MFGRGIFGYMVFGFDQGNVHLDRGIAEKAQQLDFSGDFRGHQIHDGDPQGADILHLGPVLGHDKDVFLFKYAAGG
jgi:hypothetical protein